MIGEQVEDYSDNVPEGSIISQDPGENESVEPGEAVDVTVSLGVEQVEVPEVYGVSVEAAQARLSSVGINSEPIEVAGDEAAGTALSTEPGVGALPAERSGERPGERAGERERAGQQRTR